VNIFTKKSMQILFLSRWFPYPPNNGSKLRIYNLLRGLSENHDVSLLSFSDDYKATLLENELRSICKEIWVKPWKPYSPSSWRARLGIFRSKPRSMIDTFSQEMAFTIKDVLSSMDFDLVIASEIWTAAYSQFFVPVPAVFEDLELGAFHDSFLNAETRPKRLRNWLTWKKHLRFIAKLMPAFDACTVVSQHERKLLQEAITDMGKTKVEVIPNCINLLEYQNISGSQEQNSLIFTGSFTYSANYEAMVWFISKVYPIVQARVPLVQLMITGDTGNQTLTPLDNVQLTGFVQDVRPLVSSACVSLAPIWSGGGTRLKILEAMALHTPVVSTSKGAEGLDVQDNVHLLIADTPEKYADCIIRLLKDPHLRQRIGDNAYNLVKEKYDWAVVMPHFLDFIEGLV
jgi:polysaccharide biosynthesis protein PslH